MHGAPALLLSLPSAGTWPSPQARACSGRLAHAFRSEIVDTSVPDDLRAFLVNSFGLGDVSLLEQCCLAVFWDAGSRKREIGA